MRQAGRSVAPVHFPDTAARGYVVHARCGDEQLISPTGGEFYTELEEALAIGLCWIHDRRRIKPETLRVSPVRRRNRDIWALVIRFHGVKQCGLLVACDDFAVPRRELPLTPRWWQRFSW